MVHKYFIVIILLTSNFVLAQVESNKHTIGPSVGFSFLGSTIQYGINHEFIFDLSQDEVKEHSYFGVGGFFRFFSYQENFINVTNDYTDILLGFQTNYHFKFINNKIDPWVGLVLANDFGSKDIMNKSTSETVTDDSYGGIWVGAHAGLRYWVKNNIAVNIRIGFGTLSYGALDIGFDYELNPQGE